MYAGDNSDALPSITNPRTPRYGYDYWQQRVKEYLGLPYVPYGQEKGEPKIFFCPSDTHRRKDLNNSMNAAVDNWYYVFAATYGSSYGYNYYYLGDSEQYVSPKPVPVVRISQVAKTGETIVVGDGQTSYIMAPSRYNANVGWWNYKVHKGMGANFGFLDGHVALYPCTGDVDIPGVRNGNVTSEINQNRASSTGTPPPCDALWDLQ